jgi:hemoglobin
MMLDPESSAYTRESLYKRLRGYDVIAAFVHDLMPRLRADRALAGYWKGISEDSARRGDQLLIDFICAAFEGPGYYAGRDMKTSHKGLGITEAEWEIFMPLSLPCSITSACRRAKRRSSLNALQVWNGTSSRRRKRLPVHEPDRPSHAAGIGD